jgi:hypothetical protein
VSFHLSATGFASALPTEGLQLEPCCIVQCSE